MASAPDTVEKFRSARLRARRGSADQALTLDQLVKLSPFDGMDTTTLEKQIKASDSFVLRCFENGEIICRQGDASAYTAFYVLTQDELRAVRGGAAPRAAPTGPERRESLRIKAHVYVEQKSVATVAPRTLFGWMFKRRRKAAPAGEPSRPVLRVRGGLDLSEVRRVASLYEGEIFGEMSCLNRVPRSATIQAEEQMYALEMTEAVLRRAQENRANKAFRERLESVYRERALQSHLLSFPLLEGVPDTIIQELRQKAELVELKPGERFIREGDPAADVYLVSIGQVRIIKKTPGGERVIAVRIRGDILGEIAVMSGGMRTASCEAYEHALAPGKRKPKTPGRIEVIRIRNEDFKWLLDAVPELRRRVEKIAAERSRSYEAEPQTDKALLGASGLYYELGLPQGQKLMLIDLDRCTRCDECVRGCVHTHTDGRTRLIREGPRFGNYLVPATCRQCRDPVCLIGCPVSSIHKGPGNEIVVEDWCIGCMTCANQCPYEAISMYERQPDPKSGPLERPLTARDLLIAAVCDQCQTLADGVPSCVYACPHEAAMRVDALEFFEARTSAAAPRATTAAQPPGSGN